MFIAKSVAAFVSQKQMTCCFIYQAAARLQLMFFVTFGGSSLLDKGMLRDRLALDSLRTAAII
jgi:hypothetical protein